jgi:hypothetical protein
MSLYFESGEEPPPTSLPRRKFCGGPHLRHWFSTYACSVSVSPRIILGENRDFAHYIEKH